MSPFDGPQTTSYSTLMETASILHRFRDAASYLSKCAKFDLHSFGAPVGVTRFEFRKDFWHQKTRVLGLLYGVVLRVAMFNHFSRTPTCDGHRHTQTDITRAVKWIVSKLVISFLFPGRSQVAFHIVELMRVLLFLMLAGSFMKLTRLQFNAFASAS